MTPRRGPFVVGDHVQLRGPRGTLHTVTLEPGGSYHTHKGQIFHDDLIGQPEGSVVTTDRDVAYLALRPLLGDFVLSMARGATIIYPKDAAQIVSLADIQPGHTVMEAGVGSGALSMSILRAVGNRGSLISLERREEFAEIARANVETFLGNPCRGGLSRSGISKISPQHTLQEVWTGLSWTCWPPGSVLMQCVTSSSPGV